MHEAPSETNVIWKPLEGSQSLFMSCPCNEILYEGTRGPGKTDAQVMLFRKFVGKGYGAAWRGVIFDQEYKNLDDLVKKTKQWFPKFGDGARWLAAGKDYKWVWQTGEELLFRCAKKEDDYWNYHGQEFPFIGWNELTKYPNDKLYEAMMSCNRSGFRPDLHSPDLNNPLPEIPLMIVSTTNPFGVGHNWVKIKFVDPAPAGRIVRRTREVFDPRTQKKQTITKTQVRIFGSYKENIYLSPEYVMDLEDIKDPNKRAAWLEGNWDITSGGAVDDLWNSDIHVIDNFKIPKGWRLDRSFDWGSSHPFSIGWWAEANGEEVTLPDGRVFCPPRGTLIRFHEWYGTPAIGTNEGLKLSPTKIAQGVKVIEARLKEYGIISGRVWPGPADNQISNVNDTEIDSIEQRMIKQGVRWTKSNKSPGSRRNGLELLRERLDASLQGEGPGIYFMRSCTGTIQTIPILPRCTKDPEDVDTDAEDHIYDDIRYRVLAGNNSYATSIKVKPAT